MTWENKKITGGQGEEEKQGVIEDVRENMTKRGRRKKGEKEKTEKEVWKRQEEE